MDDDQNKDAKISDDTAQAADTSDVQTPEETVKDSNEAVIDTTEAVQDSEQVIEEPEVVAKENTKSDSGETSGYDELPTEAAAVIDAKPEIKAESKLEETTDEIVADEATSLDDALADDKPVNPNAKWYVVHTYSGHENKVSQALMQRVESEHLEHKILEVLVPTQDKIEIKAGKKEQVKEKIFPGYILVKMDLDDTSWLAVRTTQGVTSFVGIGNKPTPIPEHEVKTIVKFMSQGAQSTFKDVYQINDTIKIIDGPFSDFIGKVDSVDKEKGKVRVLVSIFGRETPVELDFLQVQKL